MQEEDFKEEMVLTCDIIKNNHEDNYKNGGNTKNDAII